MEDYKPNSNKSKMEQTANSEEKKKKMEKVVSGVAKTKKKGGLTKFADVFISEDANDVKEYLLTDIAVPAIKNVIFDLVTNGLSLILHGRNAVGSRTTNASKINYNKCYPRDSYQRPVSSAPRERRTAFDYDDIIIPTRGDAEVVLDTMSAAIEKYGHVTGFKKITLTTVD